MRLSEAVGEATRFVAVGTAAGTAVEIAVFLILHLFIPEVPFGIGVVVSAVLGWAVAAGNFLLMAIAAEKSANDDNYDNAKRRMTVSYRYRTFMQLAFIVIAIVVPFLNWAAAVIPLLIPSLVIKGKGILESRRPSTRTEGIDWEDEEEEGAAAESVQENVRQAEHADEAPRTACAEDSETTQ